MAEQTPGTIITFYSYKGGTGRSMAVANVAWALACGGKKVLAMDWDLEAPGLHRYFEPFLLHRELREASGVIEFVGNFVRESLAPGAGAAQADWYAAHASLHPYAVSLNYEFPGQGRLDFVLAGRQDESYLARVNEFDWRKFYDRAGWLFLEEARRKLRAVYDYVLIDSRSGGGNVSRICTSQMADVLVPCFTLSSQSIDGAFNVTQEVLEKRPDLRIFPVPMRVDNSDSDKQEIRLKEAQAKFYSYPNHLPPGYDWQSYWDEVPIFYAPYYSYDAVLAVFAHRRKDDSILKATKTLAKYLSSGTVKQIADAALPGKEERERVLALYAGQDVKIDLSAKLNEVAENALLRLSDDERESAWRVVRQLVSVAPSENGNGTSRARLKLDDFSLSDRRLIRELQSSRLLQIETDSKGKQTVLLAQDDFLHDWQRLSNWLKEDSEFLIWLSGLRAAREKWLEALKAGASHNGAGASRAEDLLLRGDALTTALDWLEKRRAEIGQTEREYIKRSQRKQRPKENVYLDVPRQSRDLVRRAQEILRGEQREPDEMLALAKELKAQTRFSYARRLLARASKHENLSKDKEQRWKVFKELALCTYKDQDLPADERLDRALFTLEQVEDFATTTTQETLGLLGSIYKRKWEIDNQRQNLERSLYYYLRGYEQGPEKDQGYTGINAAFVLDQLASLEEGEAEDASKTSGTAERRREKARAIREDIIKQVGALINDKNHKWVASQWWYYATMAEAEFGLQNYDEAVYWLREGQKRGGGEKKAESKKEGDQAEEEAEKGQVYEWELETCARQLAALARLQDDRNLAGEEFAQTPAWAALEEAFGDNAVPRTAFMGKIGLALSGGGFRASLYHLGVLARLAELDILRYVEVLSCVSGGAIVGAHYYLKVRRLLQQNTEEEITREDYIRIVREMIDEFVTGVQQNIRTRIALNPVKNFIMCWTKQYSRTSRAGELYEQCLFSRVKDDEEDKDRWINGLTIEPLVRKSDTETFNDKEFAPKYQNWRRDAKVPMLVLNAATLNTGHTWQFTASWMGEAPAGIDSEINGNDRLRRMYYGDAPKNHKKVRLGHAVGASAAVSGVFEPLTLDKLYPGRIVRLVDGGVCDNQGIGSLLEQDCKVLLVSDASGQMESQNASSRSILGVLLRSTDIFQARIREAQYHDLKGRQRSSLLRGMMFVHLKGDLEVDPVDWINCQEPYDASDDARPPSRRGLLTRYGIAKEIQKLLSGIRTDLDSFSDAEAYALMTSGYRMTEYQFKYENCVEGFATPPTPFLFYGNYLVEKPEVLGDLLRKLRPGDNQTAVSTYLWPSLDPETQRLLEEDNESRAHLKGLQQALIKDLNRLIKGPSLYSEEHFDKVRLSEQTRKLIEQEPQGRDLLLLNRLLLEDAYPELAESQWKFLQVEDYMKSPGDGYEYLKKLLAAGGSRAFKVWKISLVLKYGFRTVLFLAAALIALLAYSMWNESPLPGGVAERGTQVVNASAEKLVKIGEVLPDLTVRSIVLWLVFTFFSIFGGYILTRILSSLVNDLMAEYVVYLVRFKDLLHRIVLGLVISTLGFVVALIHLTIFDRWFLCLGSINKLKKKGSSA